MAQNKITLEEKEFQKCGDIFEKIIYPEDKEEGLMCDLHKAFGSNKSNHHNCLGCNLDDSTHHIFMFLNQNDKHDNLQLSATTYILLMYLVIERLEIIFEIIRLPENYQKKHFPVFQKINKWANFIKHPKAFILCHHPIFILENDKEIKNLKKDANVIINNEFVFKYYSGDNNKIELFNKLANKDKVLVEIPNLTTLTNEFCNGMISFIRLIENNEVYREILHDKTTIKDFFTQSEEAKEFKEVHG